MEMYENENESKEEDDEHKLKSMKIDKSVENTAGKFPGLT